MAQPRELQIRGNVTIPPTQIERAAITSGARRFLLAMLAERERVSNFNLLACHGVSLAVAAVGQL